MLIAVIVLILVLFLAPPLKLAQGEGRDYLSKDSALPIKGFFVMWVFFAHFRGYVDFSGGGFLNDSFLWLLNQAGQLCVVMFLFYSGFGIYSSIRTKEGYMKSFPIKRFLPVWISFAICVCFFIIENLCMGVQYNAFDIAMSFTGWTSVGNSNWYMFITFILYILAYLSFRFFKQDKTFVGLIVFTLLSFALLIGLFLLKRGEDWWYNTLLCFPLGMWYAHFKDKIDGFLLKSNLRYSLGLIIAIGLTIAGYFLTRWHSIFYCAYSLAFALLVVAATMKIRFRSVPLAFLGKHVFSIYILQRLVFRVGEALNLSGNPYLFFAGTLCVTVLLAFAYDWLFAFVKGKIDSRKVA